MRHPLTLGQQIGHWTIIGLPDGKPELEPLPLIEVGDS